MCQTSTGYRSKPLSEVLAAAQRARRAAGVTRLAELTHLDVLGFPIFGAIRPNSLSLSTSMGRGETRRASMVSALLEAVETAAAENIRPEGDAVPLLDRGSAAHHLWSGAPRDPLAIRLDPRAARHWVPGFLLTTGEPCAVPFDLVSQDLTRPARPDIYRVTVGLATGSARVEAEACAIAELLEHDLEADWRRASPAQRRSQEVDCEGIDDAEVREAIARVTRAGLSIRLWSLGHAAGIAAFLCMIFGGKPSPADLPPVAGSGCHPDRKVAALRAITEAAQARVALIAGVREDLEPDHYQAASRKRVELLLSCLSFGPGPLHWSDIPTSPDIEPPAALELLTRVARARSDLPLIVVPLQSPDPLLHIVKVVAPGLRIAERGAARPNGAGRARLPPRRKPSRRRVMFVGPTLPAHMLPEGLEHRAPAVVGDLARLLADPPEAIGLVDGMFETTPSVWHKEILELLAAGVKVYGAASLGALRAAELREAGMRGIGCVYEAYAAGRIARDDAVMLVHAPAELGYRPLTQALVDVEAALAAAPMPATERRMLQRIARTTGFRERSWDAIFDAFAGRTGRLPGAMAALRSAPSIKRADALKLAALLSGSLPPMRPGVRPPQTSHHRRLLARISSTPR